MKKSNPLDKLVYVFAVISIIIVIFILVYYKLYSVNTFISNPMNHSNHMLQSNTMSNSNPCTDTLTDLEYLEHMIPHHQVAIDMSNLLVPHTQNPIMLHLCRDITRKQDYEIWEMTLMKNRMSNSMFSDDIGSIDKNETILDIHYPKMSKSKDGNCNPLFFKPNDHSNMMINMDINDTTYLEHMIPHHQVAIDMSRRLLLHTTNSYLFVFCQKLIVDQQGEIFLMNNLLRNTSNYNSKLL